MIGNRIGPERPIIIEKLDPRASRQPGMGTIRDRSRHAVIPSHDCHPGSHPGKRLRVDTGRFTQQEPGDPLGEMGGKVGDVHGHLGTDMGSAQPQMIPKRQKALIECRLFDHVFVSVSSAGVPIHALYRFELKPLMAYRPCLRKVLMPAAASAIAAPISNASPEPCCTELWKHRAITVTPKV